MIETAPSGPVALSQVWIDGKIIARDVHGDDLVDVLQQNGNASAWAVLPRTDTAALRRLCRILGIDDIALNGLLAPEHRVRFLDLGDVRLVRLRGVRSDAEELPAHDLGLIITDQMMIVLADDPYAHQLAGALSAAGGRVTRGTADRAAQVVVEEVLAGLAEAVTRIENTGDDLAEVLFGGTPLDPDRKVQAFRLRRRLTGLRRITDPTRDAVAELAESLNDGIATGDHPDPRHWTMITDHADRVATTVTLTGESLTAIFDASLALETAHTNEVMKKLAGWAAIIAVPTLITGFVGMNVAFWGAGSAIGFYVYLVLIVGVAVALFVLFRRRSWL